MSIVMPVMYGYPQTKTLSSVCSTTIISLLSVVHVDEEISFTVSPVQLQGAKLYLDMEGNTTTKEIFNGTLNISVTKTLIRKIRSESPHLMTT